MTCGPNIEPVYLKPSEAGRLKRDAGPKFDEIKDRILHDLRSAGGSLRCDRIRPLENVVVWRLAFNELLSQQTIVVEMFGTTQMVSIRKYE